MRCWPEQPAGMWWRDVRSHGGRIGSASALALLCLGCGSAADVVAPAASHVPTTEATTPCTPVEETAPVPPEHVADGVDLDYGTAPPTSGMHWAQWPTLDRSFYTTADRPAVEALVHSQEHGWTILWYDETLAADGEQLAQLRDLAAEFVADGPPKVVVVPWDSADGPLDSGHLAMTHWGADTAYRQFCDALDTDTVRTFVTDHPYTDSREPGGP